MCILYLRHALEMHSAYRGLPAFRFVEQRLNQRAYLGTARGAGQHGITSAFFLYVESGSNSFQPVVSQGADANTHQLRHQRSVR